MRKAIWGILMVLVMLAGTVGAVPLPPAGEDSADADLVISLILLQSDSPEQVVECSGPTVIKREEPDGDTIQTEILSLSLACSDGVQVRLNADPQRASRGHITAQPIAGRPEDSEVSFFDVLFEADSFFDVFFEIQVGDMTLRNEQPARINAKIVHIPPFSSPHFLAGVVPLVDQAGALAANLTRARFHLKRPLKQETRGEVSPVFSCFYECKTDRKNRFWHEMTTLMLLNQSRQALTARILFLDGNERPIAKTQTHLSSLDLDELNVCETLSRAQTGQVTAPVPSAGVIEVVLGIEIVSSNPAVPSAFLPRGGAYGWIKNLTGKKFKRPALEPFAQAVTGIGKTECRLVGPNVITAGEVLRKMQTADIPSVDPILIEGTGEGPVTQ